MSDTAPEFVELVPGTQAVPRTKSMAHRMFFEEEGRFLPVKGEFVSSGPLAEDGVVRARLFNYVLEGPPFTLAQSEPHLADHQSERQPTRYEVRAINAIHAREDVIASTAFRPGAYGPGLRILWDQLEDDCPEASFGTAHTSALAAYDAMVEAAVDYADWEAKHGQFMATLSDEQRGALCTVYARPNVEMEMRLRAGRSDHWQDLAKPVIEAEAAAAEAEAAEADAKRSALMGVAEKFRTLIDGLEGVEIGALAEAIGAGEDMTTEKLMEFFRFHGEKIIQPAVPPWAEQVIPAASFGGPPPGEFDGPPGDDWVELSPGSFPGMPLPPFPDMPVGGRVFVGDLPHGAIGGAPFPGFPPGMSPFAPGPDETFTMGDSEERDSRQLDAATAEADALRARLHADANERARKLGMFKDVLAGGLQFLLEKVEGAPPPLPPEPVGPVEQILGRTGVNGSRASVMEALTAASQFRRFDASPSVPAGASDIGAPGEAF